MTTDTQTLTIIPRLDGIHVRLTDIPTIESIKSDKYFMLSRGKNQKWNHDKLIDKIKEYYMIQSVETHHDYPTGFECWINIGEKYRPIHFELNKYDKTIMGQYGNIGEDRKKLHAYSKNGYIITLPQDISCELLEELEAIKITDFT